MGVHQRHFTYQSKTLRRRRSPCSWSQKSLYQKANAHWTRAQKQLMGVSGSESFFAHSAWPWARAPAEGRERESRPLVVLLQWSTAQRRTGSIPAAWRHARARHWSKGGGVFAGVDVTPCPCSINTIPSACAAHHLVIAPAALASHHRVDPLLWADRNSPTVCTGTDWTAAARLIPRRKRRCGAAAAWSAPAGRLHFRPCVQTMPARVGLISLDLQKMISFWCSFCAMWWNF